MASVLQPFLKIYSTYIKQRLVRKTGQVMAVQEQFLQEWLARHRQTELGKQFKLDHIRTLDQFRAQIPSHPYSFYEPYIERIAQGEKNILNPDPVVYLSVTSGTTGKRKRIPVTKRFQNSLQLANLASIGFALDELQARQLQFGKILVTNSVQILGKTTGGIEYGLATVGSLRMGRFVFEQNFAHPYDILQISDSIARHYICLLFALRDRAMRGMANNFPMLVLRTCDYLDKFATDLIEDLQNGTIADWLVLKSETRQKLEQRWKADPQRAQELRSILQREGKLIPKLAWPDLSFIGTARGGTSDFYFQRFPDYFGDTPVFGGVYGCSEATFGISHAFNNDESILAIESGFYEFVPADQWGLEHPQTLLASEVKVGERYRILVTNYTGFYRYDIGDVVEVLGFYNQTPLIVFRHRQGGLLSSTSEKTTEFHAIQVMQSLQEEFKLSLEDFCVTLSEHEVPAHYLVNIELSQGQTLDNPQSFLDRFDQQLKSVNGHYEVMRVDQVPPPRLRLLSPGSFTAVRQRLIQQGMPDSQLKIPHISEDRQFLAGLEVEQEVTMTPHESGIQQGRH